MFTAAEIIDLAIRIEKNGESLCREAAQKDIDPDLNSLLEWMAEQEVQHIKWFSELRQKVRILANDSKLEQFGRALLGDVLGDQGFSLKDADFSKIQNIKDLLSLLVEFEQDTVLFYEMIRTAVEDKKTISLLVKIITEENRHIARLQDYFNKRRINHAGYR